MNKLQSISYLDNYLSFLKSNMEQVEIKENIYRLTTPFLDRKNDFIEIYIINKDGKYTLTDDGHTIDELRLSGFEYKRSPKRKNALNTLVNSHGVDIDSDESLTVSATLDNLALKKHQLIQCIIKVSDLFMLTSQTIESYFYEDVENFLIEKEIRFNSRPSFTGKSKLTINFDFSIGGIPKRNIPERLIKISNNFDVNFVKNTIFSWQDIQGTGTKNAKLYAVINDRDKEPSKEKLEALKEYGIETVLWKERNAYSKELSA